MKAESEMKCLDIERDDDANLSAPECKSGHVNDTLAEGGAG